MSDVAGDQLEAFINSSAHRGLGHSFRWLSAYTKAFFLGDFSGAALGTIVVMCKATGEEVLRVSSGTRDETADLLMCIEQDLAQLTLSDFLAEWNATTP
ncbi:hypothetical protein [Arthrobacter sp. NPDC092385]|uniref:hypothetical protein n=1 Tax=Arthrobacter sp. NPDC092385 TaxID=3363943 RepID=UPI00130E2FE4|nr:hypothetical protein [Vibrio cholerae]